MLEGFCASCVNVYFKCVEAVSKFAIFKKCVAHPKKNLRL